MSILELATLGLIVVFAVLGLIIGLIKGAVKSGIRAIVVVLCIVVAVLFNQQFTELVYGINIDGQTLKETLMGALSIEGEGIDPAKIQELIWPIIYLISKIIVCLVSVVALLLASWVVVFIVDLIVRIFLKNKKKFRLIGALIGFVSGALVGLSIDSIITGLVPNIYTVYSLQIGDTKLSEQIPIPQETIEDLGIATFNKEEGGIGYKIGSLANPLIYNNVSTAVIDGKTYTFDGQIKTIKSLSDLAGSLMQLSELDFSKPESVGDVVKVLKSIDFNKMSEEEKQTLDNNLETGVEALGLEMPEGFELNTQTLGAINFEAVGDVVDFVGKAQNGEMPAKEDVSNVLGGLVKKNEGAEKNTIDVIKSMGVDVTNFTKDENASKMINESLDNLKNKVDENGAPIYTEEELNSLKEFFFGE